MKRKRGNGGGRGGSGWKARACFTHILTRSPHILLLINQMQIVLLGDNQICISFFPLPLCNHEKIGRIERFSRNDVGKVVRVYL